MDFSTHNLLNFSYQKSVDEVKTACADKFIAQNPLTNPRAREVLTVLYEEAAEVIQAVSKIQRFGILETHPVTGVSNRDHLSEEIGQFLCMLDLASGHNLVDWNEIHAARSKKHAAFEKYAQTEKE